MWFAPTFPERICYNHLKRWHGVVSRDVYRGAAWVRVILSPFNMSDNSMPDSDSSFSGRDSPDLATECEEEDFEDNAITYWILCC